MLRRVIALTQKRLEERFGVKFLVNYCHMGDRVCFRGATGHPLAAIDVQELIDDYDLAFEKLVGTAVHEGDTELREWVPVISAGINRNREVFEGIARSDEEDEGYRKP